MLLTLLQSGGVAAVTGSGVITLGSVSVAGVGTSTVHASGAISLGSVSVAGVGTSTVQASGAIALDSVSVAGVDTSTVTSSGAIALGSVSVAGTGAVLAFVLPGPIVGQLACIAPSGAAPPINDLVCTVGSSASLACVVSNAWAFPAVSFTRPASP